MIGYRRSISGLVVLLVVILVAAMSDAAFAQSNCQPWLRAARQESARGHPQRAEEAMNIYRECVRQARRKIDELSDFGGGVMLEADPTMYGPIIDTFVNPRGPKVVRIPGYRPNLLPGRPPGTIGIPGRPPGPVGGPRPDPAGGQLGAGSGCPGGCPPGASGGAQHKYAGGSRYGARGAPTYAGRSGLIPRAGAQMAPRARSTYATRPYGGGAYAGRSPYAARSPYGASVRRDQFRRMPQSPRRY